MDSVKELDFKIYTLIKEEEKFDPSGIRIGTPAVTSRGFKEEEMITVSQFIDTIISNSQNRQLIRTTADEVKALCKGFPAPGFEHCR